MRELVDGANDFLATTIVNSNGKSDFFIVFSFLLPALEIFLNIWRQLRKITNKVEFSLLLIIFFKMLLEELAEELKIFFNPFFSTLPILGREDPEGKIRDFKFKAVVNQIFHGVFNSKAVTGKL